MCFFPPSIHKKCGGFTLLELLVVVVIVAVLGTLLLGVGGRFRALGQSAKCKANLRAWGMAFHAYAADHDGLFPHPDNERRSDKSGLADSPHKHSWVDELPEKYMADTAWRDYPAGNKPVHGVWQCPAAKIGADKLYSYGPRKNGFFSYAMNSYLAHDFPYSLDSRAAQPSYLNTLKCEAPAKTILLFDQHTDGYDRFGYRASDSGYQTAGDAVSIGLRHPKGVLKKACNILFVDGHVETRDETWAKAQKKDPDNGDLTWYPYLF